MSSRGEGPQANDRRGRVDPVTLSVVIPTLGRPGDLTETLASIVGGETLPKEVIVVDGDADRSARPVTERFGSLQHEVAISYRASSPGIPTQRNLGMEDASGDVIVFFDDDVVVQPGLFSILAAAYRDRSVIGATGRVVEPSPHRVGGPTSRIRSVLFGTSQEGSFTRFGYPLYIRRVDREMDVEVMPGCFMSARTEAARHVGFDTELPGYALGEDEDFAYRLSRLGRIRYVPEAVILHKKLGFGTRDTRRFGQEVVINRTYLFRKNFEPTLVSRIEFGLLLLVLLFHRLLNGDVRGALGLIEGGWITWRRHSSPFA